MPARPPSLPFTGIALDPGASTPIYYQLYDALRASILAGELAPGTRLPATRMLATELQVSRTTVVYAFEQLLAEGYVDSKVGDGTYVAHTLPENLLQARGEPRVARLAAGDRSLSARGTLLAASPIRVASRAGAPHAFRSGMPALDAFPLDVWTRLITDCLRRSPTQHLDYGDAAGYRPLREAIADYLRFARGVQCTAEQVIVVSGAQQALDLTVRMLLDVGDAAWIEDPAYPGAHGALIGAGACLVPVPVDAHGLDVAAGVARNHGARLAYVTPSHQWPMGVTMNLTRRLALLDWASRVGAWIVEDDFESEYRYAGRPLTALQGLDQENRVIYIGSFSKVLVPALRLGYLVVPPDLVRMFTTARAVTSLHAPWLEQAALAAFIDEGHFARHVRRMRALYAERQAVLVEAAASELGGLLDVRPADAGMKLMGWLPEGVNDRVISKRAAAHDVEALPLSAFCIERTLPPGLSLGYTGISVEEIRAGVRRLAMALNCVQDDHTPV